MTLATLAIASLAAVPFSAEPGASPTPNSHLWVVNEVFSNADRTIQFIEFHECCGSSIENGTGGKKIFSNATGHQYTIPSNVPGNTANRYLLFGTAAFAALPGAPQPDFTLPADFFSISGDTIRWHIYPAATLSFGPGQLPLDGKSSYNRTIGVAINSPTNFAGQSGSISIAPVPALPLGWLAALALLALVGGSLVLRQRRMRTEPV